MSKIIFILMALISVFGNSQMLEAPPKLYAQFQFVVVKGKVFTTTGKPVAGVKINAFQARDGGGVFGNVNVMAETGNTTKMKKISWGRTNEKGEFTLKGIPSPGSYYLEIKGVDGFKKVQYPLRIDTGSGDVIDYVKIIMDKYIKLDKETKKLLKSMEESTKNGKLEEAVNFAKEIINKRQDIAEPYIILANNSIKAKKFDEALGYFDKVVELGTRNLQVYRAAAQVSFGLKKVKKTAFYLASGVKVGLPKDMSYYNLLFQAYYLSNQMKEAKLALGEMLDTFKDFKNRDKLVQMYNKMK